MKQQNYTTTFIEIKPPKAFVGIDLKEIWQYRDLLYILVWRNVKVRYKQTVVGVAWAIFQPLITMVIFTVFFGRLIKVPTDNIPYAVFVYTGLLYWNYFSTALTSTSDSLVSDESIIKKVYFPRIIVPIATTVTPLVDFLVAFLILFILMVFYRFMPNFWGILLLPVLMLITFMTSSGLGIFLASLNVKYRDVRYILGFFIQLLMYITPVIYSASIIPDRFRWIFYLNPMAGVITLARDSLLHHLSLDWTLLAASFGISFILILIGLFYFRRTERFFADVL